MLGKIESRAVRHPAFRGRHHREQGAKRSSARRIAPSTSWQHCLKVILIFHVFSDVDILSSLSPKPPQAIGRNEFAFYFSRLLNRNSRSKGQSEHVSRALASRST